MASYPQSLILNENEILQFTTTEVNANITEPSVSNPNVQISPSSVLQPVVDAQTLPNHIHEVLRQLINHNDSQHSQVVELSVLNDKFLSRPLILTNQQPGGAVQSLILNISGPAQPQTIICANPEYEKNVEHITESACEQTEVVSENEPSVKEKEPSTVNIINEFHSSMVKTKKESNESENEDNQAKKVEHVLQYFKMFKIILCWYLDFNSKKVYLVLCIHSLHCILKFYFCLSLTF